MIRAKLRRVYDLCISRKSVLRIMRELSLTQPRKRTKPLRPKRVRKMRPTAPNQAWQIDMTCFQLADLRPLFLVGVIDCFTRQIVGWTLDHRCRASEWTAALRQALDDRGLDTKLACKDLTVRSDNGAQPCSKAFVDFLSKCGITGQYTGYNAPDDNAYIERVFRTFKEEEIWLNEYDTFSEAYESIAQYVKYYNSQRIHSALGYRTPDEVFDDTNITLNAA
jgi:putative transposase